MFEFLIDPALRRSGVDFNPVRKIVVGMVFTAASLVAAGVVELQASPSLLAQLRPHLTGAPRGRQVAKHDAGYVSVAWQIPQYLMLSCGEILVSVTCLEFAYTQAPEALKGLVMAGFFLTQARAVLLRLLHASASPHGTRPRGRGPPACAYTLHPSTRAGDGLRDDGLCGACQHRLGGCQLLLLRSLDVRLHALLLLANQPRARLMSGRLRDGRRTRATADSRRAGCAWADCCGRVC